MRAWSLPASLSSCVFRCCLGESLLQHHYDPVHQSVVVDHSTRRGTPYRDANSSVPPLSILPSMAVSMNPYARDALIVAEPLIAHVRLNDKPVAVRASHNQIS